MILELKLEHFLHPYGQVTHSDTFVTGLKVATCPCGQILAKVTSIKSDT